MGHFINPKLISTKQPKRIISTVPSLSELIIDLDLNDELIAVTKFCVNPSSLKKNKTIIGGTKKLNIEKISALSPDLIICNKEENDKNQIELLAEEFPIWLTEIDSIKSALKSIEHIGKICHRSKKAAEIIELINQKRKVFHSINQNKKVVYLIWNNPYMVAGGDTFISSMLEDIGFTNVYKNRNRYPELSLEEIEQSGAEYVFLSSEPFPFKEKHKLPFMKMTQRENIQLVDGEAFSWYGSHLIKSYDYFLSLLTNLKFKS